MKNLVIEEKESELKQIVVDYVGNKLDLNPETEGITVEHIVEVFADQFPEFLLVVAEENWVSGYTQALNDLQFVEEEKRKISQSQIERETTELPSRINDTSGAEECNKK